MCEKNVCHFFRILNIAENLSIRLIRLNVVVKKCLRNFIMQFHAGEKDS